MSSARPPGEGFEIRVAGVSRTMRDTKEAAIEAARLLNLRNPDVRMVDLRDGSDPSRGREP